MSDSLCKICGRVKFGAWVRLQAGVWRHDECAFGSQAWYDYYNAMPEGAQKSNLAQLARCLVGSVEGSNNQTEGA